MNIFHHVCKLAVGSLMAALISTNSATAEGQFGDTGQSQWGVGFELFWDGKKVNGPETEFISYEQAVATCEVNYRPNIIVECRYHGHTFQRWTE